MLTGTIVNALAILAGAVAGMLLKQVAGKFSASLDDASTPWVPATAGLLLGSAVVRDLVSRL